MKKLLILFLFMFSFNMLSAQTNVLGSERRFEKLFGTYVNEGDTVLVVSDSTVYFDNETYEIDYAYTTFMEVTIIFKDKGKEIDFMGFRGRRNIRYITAFYQSDGFDMYMTDLNALKQESAYE